MESETRNYKIKLLTELLGTVPKDKEIFSTYIESLKPDDIIEVEANNVPQTQEKGWTGFMSDEQGLFVYEYMIKGFLKHAGNVLKEVVKVKALRSKIDDFLFVKPRKIYLSTDKPHGSLERPIRVMTMQGPRVALIKSDFINAGTEICFQLTLLPHKDLKWEIIDTLFTYGELQGLGQFRNGGYGRFEVIK